MSNKESRGIVNTRRVVVTVADRHCADRNIARHIVVLAVRRETERNVHQLCSRRNTIEYCDLRGVETLKRIVVFVPRRKVWPDAIRKHSLEVVKCLLSGKDTPPWSFKRPCRHD